MLCSDHADARIGAVERPGEEAQRARGVGAHDVNRTACDLRRGVARPAGPPRRGPVVRATCRDHEGDQRGRDRNEATFHHV